MSTAWRAPPGMPIIGECASAGVVDAKTARRRPRPTTAPAHMTPVRKLNPMKAMTPPAARTAIRPFGHWESAPTVDK
jgi:hypothetical protein